MPSMMFHPVTGQVLARGVRVSQGKKVGIIDRVGIFKVWVNFPQDAEPIMVDPATLITL